MAKRKGDLNTVYISERLQECLRPIAHCALTTVVAPMGYGKTTAVNWYLSQRAQEGPVHIVRVSVYSDNLAIFWKSVQDAFVHAGLDFLADCPCPTDDAGASLLSDDLCRAFAGETPWYIFIDDFHLLTDGRAAAFLCTLANRLPQSVHLIVASRDRFLPPEETVRLGRRLCLIGTDQLRLNHTELAVYAHRCGTQLSERQIETLLYSSEGWFSAIYLNLRTLAERGALPDSRSDIYTMFSAALIDPLPPRQREFLAVMGLADEFTVDMAREITGYDDAEDILAALTGQNAFVTRLPDGCAYRFHHMMKECAQRAFLTLPQGRGRPRPAAGDPVGRRYPARLLKAGDCAGLSGQLSGGNAEGPPPGPAGTHAQHVQLAAHPQNAGAERAAVVCHWRSPGHGPVRAGKPAGGVRPYHEFFDVQRHQRHEPPAPQRQHPDVPPGHQHPEQRRLDLWLPLGADDVPPPERSPGPGVGRDGRMYAPLL